MADRKEYYKTKLGKEIPILGHVGLKPPARTENLQSSQSVSVIDLISEGPIDGLVTLDGRRAKDYKFLEAIYLDDVPIKEINTGDLRNTDGTISSVHQKFLPHSNIQNIHELTSTNIRTALNQIRTNLGNAVTTSTVGHPGNDTLYASKQSEIDTVLTELENYIDSNPQTKNFGFIQFTTENLFDENDGHFFRREVNGSLSTITSLISFDTYFHNGIEERSIELENGDTINVPKSLFFVVPKFNSATNYNNIANSGSLTGNQAGNKYRISDFVGGGVMFFYIGNNTRLNGSAFDTGKFFVPLGDSSFNTKIQNGIDGGYDVFTRSGTAGRLAIHRASKNQKDPEIGKINEAPIKIAFNNDIEGTYNYNNIDFDFRNGYEEQAPLNLNQSRDISYSRRLLGSFNADLNKDIRGLGDFADWNANKPRNHNTYSLTHAVDDWNVESVSVTISINSLFDTVADGDDAGRRIENDVGFRIETKYETVDNLVDNISTNYIGGIEISVLEQQYPFIEILDALIVQVSPETDPNHADYLTISGFRHPTHKESDDILRGTDVQMPTQVSYFKNQPSSFFAFRPPDGSGPITDHHTTSQPVEGDITWMSDQNNPMYKITIGQVDLAEGTAGSIAYNGVGERAIFLQDVSTRQYHLVGKGNSLKPFGIASDSHVGARFLSIVEWRYRDYGEGPAGQDTVDAGVYRPKDESLIAGRVRQRYDNRAQANFGTKLGGMQDVTYGNIFQFEAFSLSTRGSDLQDLYSVVPETDTTKKIFQNYAKQDRSNGDGTSTLIEYPSDSRTAKSITTLIYQQNVSILAGGYANFIEAVAAGEHGISNGLLFGVTKEVNARPEDGWFISDPIVSINPGSLDVSRFITRYANLREALEAGITLQQYILENFSRSRTFSFRGISTSAYNKTINITIPQNKQLKNFTLDSNSILGLEDNLITEFNLGNKGDKLFPGDSWKNLKRLVTISKTTRETDSVLKSDVCYLNYVTEKLNDNYTYPLSALSKCIFDARAFNSLPSRSFQCRLKKVLVPTNYSPLRGDGSDKRIVDNANAYGRRNIFKFKGGQFIQVPNKVIIGTDNCEFSLKTKFNNSVLTTNGIRVYLSATSSNTKRIEISYTQATKQFRLIYHGLGSINFDSIANRITDLGNVYEIKMKVTQSHIIGELNVYDSSGQLIESKNSDAENNKVAIASRSGRAMNMDNTSNNFVEIGSIRGGTNKVQNGVMIADVKIKKNNQLLHHYDGTVIESTTNNYVFRDRFAGAHGVFKGTTIDPSNSSNLVTDASFAFGKNREQVYIGEWDGNFKLAWTDNPAWILYDLMVNPIYGIGNRLDDRQDINIFKLYDSARYADTVDDEGFFDGVPDSQGGLEPRFAANLMLTNSQNAYNVLSNIASIFRGMSYWDGASLTFAVDKPKEINGFFNNSNVFDGIFNYGDILANARFNRVEVTYADAKDNYNQKIEYIEDEESIRNHGIIIHKSNGIGCTSKSQAKRLGKYLLLSNKLETEMVTFQAGVESTFLTPGDIVRIDDDLKNFEINHGNILEIETGDGTQAVTPYFDIPNSVNIESIKTDKRATEGETLFTATVEDIGNIYAYNNKEQNEIKNLYDVYNHNFLESFGSEQNKYDGVVPIDEMRNLETKQVTEFKISGVKEFPRDHFLRVYLDLNNDITGVPHGSTFSVELKNNVNEFYKIINISPVEDNLYEISALQYNSGKFDTIESNDLDTAETKYNIGIMDHQVNRPLAPNTVTETLTLQSNGSYTLAGTIFGNPSSNETKYRVTAINETISGPYYQKEFRKTDFSSHQTAYSIKNLNAGTYKVEVNSLKNPESSESVVLKVDVPFANITYIKDIIKNIDLTNSLDKTYERKNGMGVGSGVSPNKTLEFEFDIRNKYDIPIDLETSESYLDIFIRVSENDFVAIEQNYKSNKYTYSKFSAKNMFIDSDEVELHFHLTSEDFRDTATYKGKLSD